MEVSERAAMSRRIPINGKPAVSGKISVSGRREKTTSLTIVIVDVLDNLPRNVAFLRRFTAVAVSIAVAAIMNTNPVVCFGNLQDIGFVTHDRQSS